MDEIEVKLNSNSNVFIVNGIEKLVNVIYSKILKLLPSTDRRKLLHGSQLIEAEVEEIKLLWAKCCSEDMRVSRAACHGLLILVELHALDIAPTMSTIVGMLPSAHNYPAIISTMAGLLILDMKVQTGVGIRYEGRYRLKSPQHPFIAVLEKSDKTEGDVMAQMHALCTHSDTVVSSNSVELLWPVFLWLTSHPQRECNTNALQLLLSLPHSIPRSSVLVACLSCLQMSSPAALVHAASVYCAAVNSCIHHNPRPSDFRVLLLMLARISTELVKHNRDPRPCYKMLQHCFSMNDSRIKPVVGITIMLLAENLTNSSALHLTDLFNLCLTIIKQFEYPGISLCAFVALSYQWFLMPAYLTGEATGAASRILGVYQNRYTDDPASNTEKAASETIFESLLYTDSHLTVVYTVMQKWERVRYNSAGLVQWLDEIRKARNSFKLEVLPLLLGIVFEKGTTEGIMLRALRIVVDLARVESGVCVQLLPVLLYKVGRDARPNVNAECLRAIPLMAHATENVPMIVSTLNKLKEGKGAPLSFIYLLYTILAETEVRCYSYLHDVLMEVGVSDGDNLTWEQDAAKAAAIYQICKTRASSHGKELVPMISSLLNRYSGENGVGTTCLCLESLALLWQAGALAPPSTWTALAPLLSADTRPKVQIGTCKLLAAVPGLRVAGPEYEALIGEAMRALWTLQVDSNEPAVIEAACDALAAYKLDDFKLKDIPEIYRKHVKLPPSYCKTPEDAARNPEDVLDYVPCEVWPAIYKFTNRFALRGVVRLCCRLIEREVKAFRSGVYILEGRYEPDILSALPPHSVLRGIYDSLRKELIYQTQEFSEPSTLALLHTVMAEYPRPLPPTEMSLLPEAFHRGAEWRRCCSTLAARQAQVSVSARRVVENYVLDIDGSSDELDIHIFFEILPILCKTMSPNSLRPPIERCLKESFSAIVDIKKKRQEEYMFITQLERIRVCLESEKIQDVNREMLAQIVDVYYNWIKEDNIAWPLLIQTCCHLPTETLERLTSPNMFPLTELALRKATAVRSAKVGLGGALTWLNDVIEAQAASGNSHEFSLRCVVLALKSVDADADSSKEWLLQLMGRTQYVYKQRPGSAGSLYMWDVFALSAIVLSGVHALAPSLGRLCADRRVRLALLPPAAAALVATPAWQEHTKLLLEWFSHSRDWAGQEEWHIQAAQRALLCMRDRPPFTAHGIWTKLEHHFQRDVGEGLSTAYFGEFL